MADCRNKNAVVLIYASRGETLGTAKGQEKHGVSGIKEAFQDVEALILMSNSGIDTYVSSDEQLRHMLTQVKKAIGVYVVTASDDWTKEYPEIVETIQGLGVPIVVEQL